MSSSFDATDRFLRPSDVGRIRRNQRRIHAHKFVAVLRNGVAVLILAVAAMWIYRALQSDARFAIRSVEVVGANHTPKAEIDAITQRYVGANLFRLDIAQLRSEIGSLRWVSRIEIEKRLPDTLRIRLIERTAVALRQDGSRVEYVDAAGVPFAELSASIGDPDLPLITDAEGPELTRTIALLQQLHSADGEVYSRISQIRPVAPRGFALFDRELNATVYANAEDISSKWRTLHAIAQAENLGSSSIEYADLRFADRVVVKPVRTSTHPVVRVAAAVPAASPSAASSPEIRN